MIMIQCDINLYLIVFFSPRFFSHQYFPALWLPSDHSNSIIFQVAQLLMTSMRTEHKQKNCLKYHQCRLRLKFQIKRFNSLDWTFLSQKSLDCYSLCLIQLSTKWDLNTSTQNDNIRCYKISNTTCYSVDFLIISQLTKWKTNKMTKYGLNWKFNDKTQPNWNF